MKKDSNIIHDMAEGLKDNKNHKKIRSFLEGLKDTVNNRNIQETMDFSEPKADSQPLIEHEKKENTIASQELSRIRKMLKP